MTDLTPESAGEAPKLSPAEQEKQASIEKFLKIATLVAVKKGTPWYDRGGDQPYNDADYEIGKEVRLQESSEKFSGVTHVIVYNEAANREDRAAVEFTIYLGTEPHPEGQIGGTESFFTMRYEVWLNNKQPRFAVSTDLGENGYFTEKITNLLETDPNVERDLQHLFDSIGYDAFEWWRDKLKGKEVEYPPDLASQINFNKLSELLMESAR